METANDEITMVVASSANCCATIAGKIQLKKSNILNLIFNDNQDPCNCICAKTFTYVFPKGKYAGFELKGYSIAESDEATVTKSIEREFYDNGNKRLVKFFEDGELKRVIFYNEQGEYVKTQYYKEGALESEHTK